MLFLKLMNLWLRSLYPRSESLIGYHVASLFSLAIRLKVKLCFNMDNLRTNIQVLSEQKKKFI